MNLLRRTLTCLAAGTLVLAGPLGIGGADAATPTWRTLNATWNDLDGHVRVGDVWSTGTRAWAVGAEDGHSESAAIVQACSGTTCTRAVLPGADSWADSISGTSASDIWAVGAQLQTDGNVATAWHFDGRRWSNVSTGITGDVELTDIVTPTGDESWALGVDNHQDGVTTAVYHRTGSAWTEVSPVTAPVFPGACADWSGNRFTDLTVVAGSLVLVGSCDGRNVVLKQDGTAWRDLDAGLPSDTTWTNAATISDQVWITGSTADHGLRILRRDAGVWRAVPTTGVPATPYIADLGGTTTTAAWLVGLPTQSAFPPASWRFNGTSWTQIPLSSDTVLPAAVSVSGRGTAFTVGQDMHQPVAHQGSVLRAT